MSPVTNDPTMIRRMGPLWDSRSGPAVDPGHHRLDHSCGHPFIEGHEGEESRADGVRRVLSDALEARGEGGSCPLYQAVAGTAAEDRVDGGGVGQHEDDHACTVEHLGALGD
jgi:hypothetical protein